MDNKTISFLCSLKGKLVGLNSALATEVFQIEMEADPLEASQPSSGCHHTVAHGLMTGRLRVWTWEETVKKKSSAQLADV